MRFSLKTVRVARLLPGVVLAGAAVFALRTSDLIEAAYAVDQPAAAAPATPVAANADYAGADEEIASAAEADVLSSLARRRAQLDGREAQMKMQAQILAATEQRLDTKIAQLKTLQDRIAGLLEQRDEAQKAQIAALVKTYTAMKPKQAALIFENLKDGVLVPVAQAMKSDVLAPILASMSPAAAQSLTLKLADRLALPDTTDALAPVQGPVQAAAAAPAAPIQTAAATPVQAPAAQAPAAQAPAAQAPAAPKN